MFRKIGQFFKRLLKGLGSAFVWVFKPIWFVVRGFFKVLGYILKPFWYILRGIGKIFEVIGDIFGAFN